MVLSARAPDGWPVPDPGFLECLTTMPFGNTFLDLKSGPLFFCSPAVVSVGDARHVSRSLPVIAVTASVMTQDRRQILAAGFDAYQPKPITVKAFLDAVRETLDRNRGTVSGA